MTRAISVRWTIGDVSLFGFEALSLSLWGAYSLFGDSAKYTVCVNTVDLSLARALTGEVPPPVQWRDVSRELSPVVGRWLDGGMAEGVGWKFAPLVVYPELPELALDNDCILWELPRALETWLAEPTAHAVLAEDVLPCFGSFAPMCGPEPRNSGIRALPPRFALGEALSRALAAHGRLLSSELDEQGLQVAALTRASPVRVVTVDEVTICGPFPPHLPHLGRCGAHFVGLNARVSRWSHEGRPAHDVTHENWSKLKPAVAKRVRGRAV